MYKYKGMQLEVPKDQYDRAVELFEEKIRQGKVEGVNNPAEAKISSEKVILPIMKQN